LNEDVPTVEDALQGARDIVAETISDNANVRSATREKALKFAKLTAEKIEDAVDEKRVYESYYEFEGRVDRLQPHQVLAIARGEKEGILKVRVHIAERDWLDPIQSRVRGGIFSARLPTNSKKPSGIPPSACCCRPSSVTCVAS
jgi:protein Tex